MVNNFIYDQGVMPELAVRLREYFNQSYRMDHVSGYEKILNKMTKALRAEVALEMHGEAMGGVWYLQEDRMQMSPDDHQRFIEALCVKLCLRMYAPKEYMDHPGHLKVLKRGVATVGGRVKRAIAVWGLEMIVPAAIRTDSVAFSLTFCELYTLSNEELFECAQTHLHRALQETPHSVGVSRLRVMQLWMVLITSSKKVGREKIRQRERAGELAASSSNVLTSSNVASLWGHIFSTENGDLGASRVGSPAVGKPPPLVQKSWAEVEVETLSREWRSGLSALQPICVELEQTLSRLTTSVVDLESTHELVEKLFSLSAAAEHPGHAGLNVLSRSPHSSRARSCYQGRGGW